MTWFDAILMADAWSNAALVLTHVFIADHLFHLFIIVMFLPHLVAGMAMCALAGALPLAGLARPSPRIPFRALRVVLHIFRFSCACTVLTLFGIMFAPRVHHSWSHEFRFPPMREQAKLLWGLILCLRCFVQVPVLLVDVSGQPAPLPSELSLVIAVSVIIAGLVQVLVFLLVCAYPEDPSELWTYELVVAGSTRTVFADAYDGQDARLHTRSHVDRFSGFWFNVSNDGSLSIESSATGRSLRVTDEGIVADGIDQPACFSVRRAPNESAFKQYLPFARVHYVIQDLRTSSFLGEAARTDGDGGERPLQFRPEAWRSIFWLRRVCRRPHVPISWLHPDKGCPSWHHVHGAGGMLLNASRVRDGAVAAGSVHLEKLRGGASGGSPTGGQRWEFLPVAPHRQGLRCYIRLFDGCSLFLHATPGGNVQALADSFALSWKSVRGHSHPQEWLLTASTPSTCTIQLFADADGTRHENSCNYLTADHESGSVTLTGLLADDSNPLPGQQWKVKPALPGLCMCTTQPQQGEAQSPSQPDTE